MMDTRNPNGMLATLADCSNPSREDEFKRWFNEVCMPGLAALECLRHYKHFENVMSHTATFQGKPKYLSLSEVYGDDFTEIHREIKASRSEMKSEGKVFDAYLPMLDMTLFRSVGPEIRTDRTGRAVAGIYVVLCFCTDPSREEEFNRWYDRRHAPDALALGAYDTAYRYKIVDPMDAIPYRPYYLTIYETSKDPLQARKDLVAYRYKWFSDPLWVELLGVYWTGGFRQIFPPS
jgi:hypothetical protein